jgi:2-polyprenyl-3-methyl-5-hydroxy-6-metoxy-1,4-benzoquinol methylase/glycosyltransferase involved in cell wall biosynthesis
VSRIAACYIVKDAEAVLEESLASVRPIVDGVFIYDTGSTDGTFDLIKRLNKFHSWKLEDGKVENLVAQPVEGKSGYLAPIVVERGEWRENFSWARTQSFAMVPEDFDWFLWLDDDDVIEGAPNIRTLAETAADQIDGFIFFYDYARDEHDVNVCQLWRERLMRRSAGYTWTNPIHEVLVPPEGKAPALVQVPAEVVRYIHKRPAENRYPPERNLRILLAEKERLEAEGLPVDPRTLAYLGTEHMARGEFANAVPWLQEYLTRPDALWMDERAQVYHKLASCARILGDIKTSIRVEMDAHIERDDWAENAVGLAQSFAMMGNWPRAEREAKRALAFGMPQSALILNPLEFTLVPLLIIADACLNTGRGEEAKAAIAQASAMFPANEQIQQKQQEIERAVAENSIVEAIMLLREQLVRHDENLKAHHLLESVPYFVTERPEIVKARADQREMVKHYLKPEEYRRWYAEEPKESPLEDEHIEFVGEAFPRAQRLLDGLREQEEELGRKPRLLDLGANDAWLEAFLWKEGEFVADGIELNKSAAEKGKARLERFGAPGRIVQGDLHEAHALMKNGSGAFKYDAVSLFEVIEHVPDVERTLKVCERMLRPGGRVYISTPNGAYERGMLDAWAHVERKGHLRAITIHQLADIAKSRGEIKGLDLQHEGRLAFLSYAPKKRKAKIVFYAGGSWEPWSPASINKGGLGGSETALVQVSQRMALAGYDVTVYSGAEEGIVGGALWRPFTAWDPTEESDLLVVSRLPHVFENPIGAKASALWCHDHSYPGLLTEERAENMTHVVTLSNWERQRFANLYPFLADKLVVIRNGISYRDTFTGETRYPNAERPFAERKPRCVYSSSADRGLDVMLEVWPQIKRAVPEAELHVFYGWDVFDRVAMGNPGLMAYKQRVLALLTEAQESVGGVVMRGRKGQRKLAAEMQRARVWSYPTAFLETSCIGAMEARAAGLALVTSGLGALPETVTGHGYLIPWSGDEDAPHNNSVAYRATFVAEVIEALSNEERWTALHRAAREDVETLDWAKRMGGWEALVPTRVKVPA